MSVHNKLMKVYDDVYVNKQSKNNMNIKTNIHFNK